MFEVELKFPVDRLRDTQARLRELAAAPRDGVEQCDEYFRHPQRDFASTDEALRIRTVDESCCITYKGPVVDDRTKTRREIEIGLAGGAGAPRDMRELLMALGFTPVRVVRKQRVPWQLTWEGRRFEVALDSVVSLGDFVEIETLAEPSQVSSAVEAILRLAERLELSRPVRLSYLALLEARDCQNS
jgi:adenylate cyclase class 2